MIPVLVSISGGILVFSHQEMMMNASNIWIALGIGMVSGASSTGANQMIKQFKKIEKEKKENETK